MELLFAAVMGILLFGAKAGSFYLLTGGENQRRMPFTNIGIRDWCHKTATRRGAIDIAFGYLGSHIIPTTSIIGLVSLSSYMIACMSVLFWPIFKNKTKTRIQGLREALPF